MMYNALICLSAITHCTVSHIQTTPGLCLSQETKRIYLETKIMNTGKTNTN